MNWASLMLTLVLVTSMGLKVFPEITKREISRGYYSFQQDKDVEPWVLAKDGGAALIYCSWENGWNKMPKLSLILKPRLWK